MEFNKSTEGMEWYAFVEDVNNKRIISYNIFNVSTFRDDIKSAITSSTDKETLAEKTSRILRYHFSGRTEWEITMSGFPNTSIQKKINVFEQVYANFKKFIDYLWSLKEN